jgi:hypothetical protein
VLTAKLAGGDKKNKSRVVDRVVKKKASFTSVETFGTKNRK